MAGRDRPGRVTSLAACSPKRDRNTRTDYPNGIAVPLLQVYSNPAPGFVTPRELLFRSAQQDRPDEELPRPRRSARQLREREVDELVARYGQVGNMRQVAREFCISRTTVAKALVNRGVATSRGMSSTEIAQAVALYDLGESSITIGRKLGFNNHTVLRVLRQAGVRIRTPLGR